MNIRLTKEADIARLVEIWYESSLIAHDFIDKSYWKSKQKEMKETYLPMSETFIICEEENIVGFLSMVDCYLAALFIDSRHQGKGYGKKLLTFVQGKREHLKLKVYSKNDKAVRFYLHNGFVKKEELLDDQTGEQELLMEWRK